MAEVTIRPWQDGDLEALCTLAGRIDRTYLSSRLPDPYTPEIAAQQLSRMQKEDGRTGVWRAIALGGRLVGSVCAEQQQFPEGCRDATLSCWIDPDFCGRGLGKQAVRTITALAFDRLPVVRLTAWICAPNTPSRRAVEQAGFTREALLRQAAAHGEENWDLCIYGKLRSEQ